MEAKLHRASREKQRKTRCEGPEARRHTPGGSWEGAPKAVVEARLQHLRIPPNYPEATLCLNPASRVQAYARDAKGRLQILYHERVVTERQENKTEEVVRLSENRVHVVQTVRTAALRGEPLGLVAWILLETAARPGHERHRITSGTHGASNLRCEHVLPQSVSVELRFPAKHGKTFSAVIQDPDIARVLFQRVRRVCTGKPPTTPFWGTDVDAEALNAYLDTVLPGLRAKHIRTWRANLHFLIAWSHLEKEVPDPDRRVTAAVRATSLHLQNTPAVARKQYLLASLLDLVRNHPQQVTTALARASHPSDAMSLLLAPKKRSSRHP